MGWSITYGSVPVNILAVKFMVRRLIYGSAVDNLLGQYDTHYYIGRLNLWFEDKYMGRSINYGSTDNLWVGDKFMGWSINYGSAIKLFIGR
jgi:hypothetical protein